MVIGGLANAKWGNPRATLDVDITIWLPESEIQNLLSLLEAEYIFLVKDPLKFIAKTRVLPLKNNIDQRIDLIFASLPFEKDALDRAIKVRVGRSAISFCTPEDLIIMKIISDRTKDLEDVRGIIRFQREQLDYGYLEPRIAELADLLEKPEIKKQWDEWKIRDT